MIRGRFDLMSEAGLAELRRRRWAGAEVEDLARAFGVGRLEVNRALDALLGRTPADALRALKRMHRLEHAARPRKPRPGLRAFLQGMFGHG